MAEKWKKWWKSIVIGLVIIAVLILLVFIVINRNEPWTGFGELPKSETTIPAKTLWDWLDLFVVSFIVALALFWLNTSQKRREDEREKDREEKEKQRQIDNQQQATLLDYYDKMSKLILEERLGRIAARWEKIDTPEKASVVVVARAVTLSIFRNLDPNRNASILRFLGDAELADKILRGTDTHNVNFSNSDLRQTNLEEAYLSRANLSEADLSRADLSRADLSRADLSGADLSEADLSRTDLSRANLSGAKLFGTDLSGARLIMADLCRAKLIRDDLSGANLTGANLTGTRLREANLSGAWLSGANLSEADLSGVKFTIITTWPVGFDPKAAGAILVDDEGNPIEYSDEEE